MLLSCGDALIDFVPVKAADGRDAYVPAVGGSCLDVAVAVSRLGSPTGFVGGISTGMFGTMVVDHLAASNVSLRHALRRRNLFAHRCHPTLEVGSFPEPGPLALGVSEAA